ncbi:MULTISPECIES: Uma2 family endonuclease [Streptomyces]|uniref:Endonuclease, Uma2 family (Restriction endonuclease fold) n=1 Tax=Streptomyces melanosporofaciens TaxID=67327 RepID=A0A1H4TS34_STRMJ|nr:Uma2 family endonuclease [Streptomyces melanosporofaciens]SEC59306.1 Endonuclease, Uma2 family (restriction endonuclease fold) [Streptomyces melanosporofaciens]
MTVMAIDRIEMADSSDELTLDAMFEALEKMPVPEGIKVEIVEGNIFMSPQRDVHWYIIRRIVRALEDRFGVDVNVLSDVRIDYPGYLNGFATDVTLIAEGAVKNSKGQWCHQDVEFVAEVISKRTGANDYGPKKSAYATAEVPVYLIIDPYTGRCHLFTEPKDGAYLNERTVPFGGEVDLTNTVVDLTLTTDEFPRD